MRQRFEHGGQERLDHQYLRTDVEVERKLEIALRQDGAVVQASGDIEPHIHSAELCRRYLHGRTAGQVEHMGWCPPWHSFSSARLTSVAIMRDRHGGSRRCHSPMPWATAVTLSLPLRLPMSRYFRLEGEPSCAREAERPWSSNVEPVVGSEKAGRASLHPCHVGLLCVAVASLSAHGLARTDNAGRDPAVVPTLTTLGYHRSPGGLSEGHLDWPMQPPRCLASASLGAQASQPSAPSVRKCRSPK